MTKAKKRILVCGIASALVLSLIYLVFFSGFKMYISYVECSKYDDFDSVVDDFEKVTKIVKEHGSGRYSILSGLSKYENQSYNDISLTNNEKESIENIYSYCHLNSNRYIDKIRVGDDYVSFEYEDFIDCGIVYTTDINSHWGFFSDYGYTKLAKNWYAYYR